MNKKAIIAVLSALVLTVVASVSLILTVGQKANADSEPTVGVLDKAEYFHFTDAEHTIIDGLSYLGCEYAGNFGTLEAVIPNGVKEITGRYCGFDKYGDIYASVFDCYDAEYVELNDDNVGNEYFNNFWAEFIVKITLPKSLETIGNYALHYCYITEITIPENVTTIGEHAFDDCYVQNIFLENEDLLAHPSLQPYVDKLMIIGVLDKEEYFKINDNGVLCGLSDEGRDYAEQYDRLYVVVPTTVKGLSSVDGRWHGIGRYYMYFGAFDWFDNLDYVDDGNYEYFNTKVYSVVLPDSLESIFGYALKGTNISTIIIPNSITSFEHVDSYYQGPQCCFSDCDSLTTIYCECSEEYANEHWDIEWKVGCDAEVVWNCNKTITFDTQNGSTVDNQIVRVDSLVTKPTDPTKEGYTFKGWYNGEEAYDFTTPVTDSMTLTAKWEAIPEPTEPEVTNPETPSEQENTETVKNENNNKTLALGIAGGSVAGLGAISAVATTIIVKKRRR